MKLDRKYRSKICVLRHLVIFNLALIFPAMAEAGFDEYDILDFATCTSYVLTDNTWDPNFPYERDDQRLQKDVPMLQHKHDESWDGWLLYDETAKQLYVGACLLDETLLQCDGVGSYPLTGIRCKRPVGYNNEKCTQEGVADGKIRLYWVDTNEHEDESPVLKNRGYERDLARMKSLCGKRPDGKEARRRAR